MDSCEQIETHVIGKINDDFEVTATFKKDSFETRIFIKIDDENSEENNKSIVKNDETDDNESYLLDKIRNKKFTSNLAISGEIKKQIFLTKTLENIKLTDLDFLTIEIGENALEMLEEDGFESVFESLIENGMSPSINNITNIIHELHGEVTNDILRGLLNSLMGELHTLKGVYTMSGVVGMANYVDMFENLIDRTIPVTVKEFPEILLEILEDIKKLTFEFIEYFKSFKNPPKKQEQIMLDKSKLIDILYLLKNGLGGSFPILLERVFIGNPLRFKSNLLNITKETSVSKKSSSGENKGEVIIKERMLEDFMEVAGSLILFRNRVVNFYSKLLQTNVSEKLKQEYGDIQKNIDLTTEQLQQKTMELRMKDFSGMIKQMSSRVWATASQQQNKGVIIHKSGEKEKLDRTLEQYVSRSLMHLASNAVVHGIESFEEREKANKPKKGVIEIKATSEEDFMCLTIRDDGRGINPETIKQTAIEKGIITKEQSEKMNDDDARMIIFAQGFTSIENANELAGKGVGMAEVKDRVEKIGGHMTISSKIGEWTEIKVFLPKTISIVNVLLISIKGVISAIPLNSIIRVGSVKKKDIEYLNERPIVSLSDGVLDVILPEKIFKYNEFLNITKKGEGEDDKERSIKFIILTGSNGKRAAFLVSELLGKEQAILKELYIKIPGTLGSTITGGGDSVLILDPNYILDNDI